jgi:hypothetical protein
MGQLFGEGAFMADGVTRKFATGATRDADTNKPDFDGFLSPLVLASFGRYMHKHRQQSDGSLRASDNWQKGIPLEQYVKSLWRHFVDMWSAHRGYPHAETLEDSLCAILFNAMGYLHEYLRNKETKLDEVRITLPASALPEAKIVCEELREFYRRRDAEKPR